MLITQKIKKMFPLKNVSLVILLLKICLVFGQKKVIVIDPGHGGKDSGAIGVNHIQEKDVVLKIAKEMFKLNKALFDNGFDMYLTRYKDTLISLTDRGRLANALKADVFISLHCNAAKTRSKGIEVYVHNSGKGNIKSSIALGMSVMNESTQKLGSKKRGIKFADFQVLREADSYLAILVEMGFMNNPDEANYFLKSENIKAMALAILMGITNFSNML